MKGFSSIIFRFFDIYGFNDIRKKFILLFDRLVEIKELLDMFEGN